MARYLRRPAVNMQCSWSRRLDNLVSFATALAPDRPKDRRWSFVLLVTIAIAISYFDRQTLPVAISAIQRSIPITDQQFSYLQTAFLLAYAALYAIGGRLLDRLGTRAGFILIML